MLRVAVLCALAGLAAIALTSCAAQRNSVQQPEPAEMLRTTKVVPTELVQSTTVSSESVQPTKVEPTMTPTIKPEQEQYSERGNADVLFVVARQNAGNSWQFSVTVEHPDKGWEDYADGWDVVLPDGTVVKPDADSPFTRLLLHPHETEQPFTRSQSSIIIAPGVAHVTVRAHDIVDGWGGKEVIVDLTSSEGFDFEVQRR